MIKKLNPDIKISPKGVAYIPTETLVKRRLARIKETKYRNQKTEVDGIRFDSKKEAARWSELKLLERAGEIESLERQPKYVFETNGVTIGSYKPDFKYFDKKLGWVVEDVKSPASKTTAYRLRKKMMFAFHGLRVVET